MEPEKHHHHRRAKIHVNVARKSVSFTAISGPYRGPGPSHGPYPYPHPHTCPGPGP